MTEPEIIILPEADPRWTLAQWQLFIQELIAKHGPRSILSTDAGCTYCELVVEVRE